MRHCRASVTGMLLLLTSTMALGSPPVSCGGTAPETSSCETTFAADSAEVGIGFHLQGFRGLLEVKVTSTSAIRQLTCLAVGGVTYCNLGYDGEFVAGQVLRLEGSAYGSGSWEAQAHTVEG
jgi:hypothetical protein